MKRRTGISLALAAALSRPTAAAAAGARPDASPEAGRAAIEECVSHYFAAGDTNSAAELKKAFHPGAMMFFAGKDGQLAGVSMPDWWARTEASPKPPTKALARALPLVDVEGDTAVAKVVSDYPDFQFQDYMLLVRSGVGWRIVSKIFHRRMPAGAPLPTEAEAAADKAAIGAVLETFFTALDTHDPDLLGRAFHPRAATFTPLEGQATSVPLAEWQARFAADRDARKPVPKTTRRVLSIDTSTDAATAKLLHVAGDERRVSFANLVKVGGSWRLVGVVHTRSDRPT